MPRSIIRQRRTWPRHNEFHVSRQAETALVAETRAARADAERLKLALEAGELGDWSYDPASDLVILSPRCAEVFGLPHAPITWAAMRDLLHPEDRERARLAVEQSVTDRTIYNIEYRVNRPSGDQCWVAARGQGFYAADGALMGLVGVVQRSEEHTSELQSLAYLVC